MEPKFTKNNKPYKALEVECAGEVRKVNMWSNFPDFVNIRQGALFHATMTKEGEYWNLSHPVLEKPRGGAPGAFKGAQIEKAQDRKNEFIGKTLDRKEESIKLMAAQRDAVLIVVEGLKQTPFPTDEEIKREIIKWRNYFLLDNDFNNPPPF